ncbi:MAG: DinB family protein [Candidatus Eisenbacteria bacterium]|nr:DinB family protein [Candidatus Eisenbacteria bacterium]
MNREVTKGMWDQFRRVHGVTLRAIQRIPADKLNAVPVPPLKSVKDLVVHMYEYAPALAAGVGKGKLEQSDLPAGADKIQTVADLEKWCRAQFDKADAAVQKLSDAQLQAMVPTFWGPTMPGFILLCVVYDEHIHHRGQFYTFLRLLGVEPPFIWGFEQNEKQYQ